jgi:hypothetical protein
MGEERIASAITAADEYAAWKETLGIEEWVTDPSALTWQELEAMFDGKCSMGELRRKLEEGIENGTVIKTKKYIKREGGRRLPVTAYILQPQEGG